MCTPVGQNVHDSVDAAIVRLLQLHRRRSLLLHHVHILLTLLQWRGVLAALAALLAREWRIDDTILPRSDRRNVASPAVDARPFFVVARLMAHAVL